MPTDIVSVALVIVDWKGFGLFQKLAVVVLDVVAVVVVRRPSFFRNNPPVPMETKKVSKSLQQRLIYIPYKTLLSFHRYPHKDPQLKP